MPRFPASRIYPPRRRRWRAWLATLVLMLLFAAWFIGNWNGQREPVPVNGQPIYVTDGDSFSIGTRKLRLNGIDAPELHQDCNDSNGQPWPCGRTARAALEKLLTQPGLACEAEAQDKYRRSVAHCKTASEADIGGAQVREGMAVSHDYYGSRTYADEEDAAQNAKRGIWQGEFAPPDIWRAQHPR